MLFCLSMTILTLQAKRLRSRAFKEVCDFAQMANKEAGV
jgi:hypothetical protein